MRQTTLTQRLSLNRTRCTNGIESLIGLLHQNEEELAFHAVVPHGNVLKSVAELLMRCAPHVSLTVDPREGLSFLACDQVGGRLIHVVLTPADMAAFVFQRTTPMRCMLESNSLHAVFHQLSRAPTPGTRGGRPASETQGQGGVVRHPIRAVRSGGGAGCFSSRTDLPRTPDRSWITRGRGPP